VVGTLNQQIRAAIKMGQIFVVRNFKELWSRQAARQKKEEGNSVPENSELTGLIESNG